MKVEEEKLKENYSIKRNKLQKRRHLPLSLWGLSECIRRADLIVSCEWPVLMNWPFVAVLLVGRFALLAECYVCN